MNPNRLLAKAALLKALQELHKAFNFVAWHQPQTGAMQGNRQGHKYINKYFDKGYWHYVYKYQDPHTGEEQHSTVRHPEGTFKGTEFMSDGDNRPTSWGEAAQAPGSLAHTVMSHLFSNKGTIDALGEKAKDKRQKEEYPHHFKIDKPKVKEPSTGEDIDEDLADDDSTLSSLANEDDAVAARVDDRDAAEIAGEFLGGNFRSLDDLIQDKGLATHIKQFISREYSGISPEDKEELSNSGLLYAIPVARYIADNVMEQAPIEFNTRGIKGHISRLDNPAAATWNDIANDTNSKTKREIFYSILDGRMGQRLTNEMRSRQRSRILGFKEPEENERGRVGKKGKPIFGSTIPLEYGSREGGEDDGGESVERVPETVDTKASPVAEEAMNNARVAGVFKAIDGIRKEVKAGKMVVSPLGGLPVDWNKKIPNNGRVFGDVMKDIYSTYILGDVDKPPAKDVAEEGEGRKRLTEAANAMAYKHYREDHGGANPPSNISSKKDPVAYRRYMDEFFHPYYGPYSDMVSQRTFDAIADYHETRMTKSLVALQLSCNLLSLLGTAKSKIRNLGKTWGDDFRPETWRAAVNMAMRQGIDESNPSFWVATQNIYNRLSWDKGEQLPPDMTQLVGFNPDIPIPDASMWRPRQDGIKIVSSDVDIQPI